MAGWINENKQPNEQQNLRMNERRNYFLLQKLIHISRGREISSICVG